MIQTIEEILKWIFPENMNRHSLSFNEKAIYDRLYGGPLKDYFWVAIREDFPFSVDVWRLIGKYRELYYALRELEQYQRSQPGNGVLNAKREEHMQLQMFWRNAA